jgi:hypothetical protein
MILRNRHVVVAMLVAPVLAMLAWFAVDALVGERPHAAREGGTYPLAAKPGCRYGSGACELENADFKITIRPESLSPGSVSLSLASSHALDSAVLEIKHNDAGSPVSMSAQDQARMAWHAVVPRPEAADGTLRIAVTAQGTTWYAEVPTTFLEAER